VPGILDLSTSKSLKLRKQGIIFSVIFQSFNMRLLSFIKEEEKNCLPVRLSCVEELISYLTKLNNNIMVYVKEIYADDEDGNKIYEMSNGLSYKKHGEGKWFVV